jgi:hypothetical protein
MNNTTQIPVPLPANAYLLEGIVRVCMCCHPNDTIFQLRPEWRELGLRVSHGLCPSCKDAMLASVKEAA